MATKLYVGNLAYAVGSTDLETMFTPHGTVESAQVIIDRDTGRSKVFQKISKTLQLNQPHGIRRRGRLGKICPWDGFDMVNAA